MKDEDTQVVTIHSAKQDELSDILRLLDECELPKEGLAAHLSTTLVTRTKSEIVGCSALELYGDCALLRSVAVKASHRNEGLGRQLIRAALDLASRHGVRNVYLLTETAATLFSKLGFKVISRSDVPEIVKQSVEFTALCPNTATVMTIRLRQEP